MEAWGLSPMLHRTLKRGASATGFVLWLAYSKESGHQSPLRYISRLSKCRCQAEEKAPGWSNCVARKQSTEINDVQDVIEVLPVSLKPDIDLF